MKWLSYFRLQFFKFVMDIVSYYRLLVVEFTTDIVSDYRLSVVKFVTQHCRICDRHFVGLSTTMCQISIFTLLFVQRPVGRIFDSDGVEFAMISSQFFDEPSVMSDDVSSDLSCRRYGDLVK